jgi:pyruvate formate-lyase/glycerol dehydratase family glycyl radical enzyme
MSSITLDDLSLRDIDLGRPLQLLRRSYFDAAPEICTERARLITRFSLEAGLFGQDRISSLDKACLYRKVLENRMPVVWHSKAYQRTEDGMREFAIEDCSPFAGSTTSKFKGVPLYPEFLTLGLWPELRTISRRAANPYQIGEEDIGILNFEVFPRWMNGTITELARIHGNDDDRGRMQLLQKLLFFVASKPNCISHTVPDFSRALDEGLRAVIDECLERRQGVAEPEKRDFYQAMAEAMEGIVAYARNLSAEAARMADAEPDPGRKAALEQMARIYSRVPEFPAASFREGLTAVWICWTAVHLENPNVGLSLGRLDQLLYGLYSRDIREGRVTVDEAVQLLGHLWLKIGDHVPTVPDAGEQLFGGTGSNQAITIGGVDAQGRDAVNDLTYVMLRATELMKLRDPNLNARFFPEVNEDRYLRRLCEANIKTGATPALHNDRAVIRSLVSSGHTLAQARDYAVIGCVEPGSNGRFYGHSGAVLLNLPSVLELTLFNGRHRNFGDEAVFGPETGDPATFASFAEFQAAFGTQLTSMVNQAVALNDHLGRIHQRFYPTPVLSALFEGPMEKGMDLIDGGAAVNASGIAVIGLADVADSLAAIETVVFEEKVIGLSGFLEALRNDYKGHEPLLARLRNPRKTPRFGNDDPRAGAHASWLVEKLHEAVRDRTNYRGGPYRVGYWTMTNHAGFGRFTGATPNGRRKGENFASGLTPCSGVTPGLVPALHSVACLAPEHITNGLALNLKFTPDDGDPVRMLDNFVAFVRGYFDAGGHDAGGMEIQFNVTSHADFLAAVEDPGRYSELLVRVSGYTAYFKDLSPMMQKEIIERTEYRLSTGGAVNYDPVPLTKGVGHGD